MIHPSWLPRRGEYGWYQFWIGALLGATVEAVVAILALTWLILKYR